MNPNPNTEQAAAAVKFTKFEVVTDGTAKGTTIKINGKEVDNLSSLSFYWYGGSYCPLSLSYTVRDPQSKPGELHSCTTYYLRCPEPVGAYATDGATVAKAEAAAGEVLADSLYFQFAKADNDPIAAAIQVANAEFKRSQWAQL